MKNISILSSLKLPEEFKIPLLQQPKDFTFELLSGSVQKIFSYELPTLNLPRIELTIPIKIPLPILPIVGIQINEFLEASAQLGFGFDTTGFKSGNFQDGFYVDTKGDEFNLKIGPKFGPYLGVTGLAEVNVKGTLGGNFGFNLADGGDGEIRWNEIKDILDKPQELIGDTNIGAILGIGGAVEIFTVPVFEPNSTFNIPLDKISASQVQEPFDKAQDQFDKLRGYLDQIQDLKNGLSVSRLVGQAKDFVVDKADQAGNWTREKADQLGNFTEEQFKDGIRTVTREWDKANSFVKGEIYKAGKLAETVTKQGEKLISIGVNGAEKIWNGANTTYKEGARVVDWVGDTVKETLPNLVTNWSPDKKIIRTFLGATPELTITRIWEGSELKSVGDAAGRILDKFGNILGEGGKIVGKAGEKVVEIITNPGSFFGLVDDEDPNQAPLRPNKQTLVGSPPDINRPPATNPITYRPDGSIWLQTGIGADVVEGSEADDEIRAGAGNDYVAGKGGKDFLYGEGGDDVLDGGAGADRLKGGTGNDKREGGAGNDILKGDAGNDQLVGGDDNDQLYGGIDNDTLNGGSGKQPASYLPTQNQTLPSTQVQLKMVLALQIPYEI